MSIKTNQKGFSSILFAMIFSVIISLLAIGFATLVRNDQRQALDQSLGYQAQYAAEAAVNIVQAGIKDKTISGEQTTCKELDIASADSSVSVPCVTWTNKTDTVRLGTVGTDAKTFKIKVAADDYDSLKITYTVSSSGKGTYASGSFPTSIDGTNNYPILRLIAATPDFSTFSHGYVIPTGGGGAGTIPSNGTVVDSICDASSCQITLNGVAGFSGYISIAAIGQQTATLDIQALKAGVSQDILDAQYVVDVTAIAEDVTKRIEARIPALPQTWRPGFVIASDKICKDIKIDGTNSAPISASGTVCP